MGYDSHLRARCRSTTASRVETIADRTGLDESEVIRRLVHLGLQDIEEIGDEVLLGASPPAAPPTTSD